MSLLGKEKALIENDYFQVWEIVEMLREYSNGSWEDVGEFLGHYNFDTELTLYCRDGFHRMHEVRNNHGPIRNLIHGLSIAWLEGEESIQKIKIDIIGYYWAKDEIYNLKPLINLNIIAPPEPNVEYGEQNTQSNIAPIKNIDFSKLYLYKTPLLTLHEAACIISENNPETVDMCRNDSNFPEYFASYLRALSFLDACVGAGEITCHFDIGSRIDATELKSCLHKNGIIVDGFNDQIDEPLHTESTEHKTVIANLELDLAIEKTKVEKLNEEISHLKAHIAELESKKMQYPQKENAINDDKINIANSDLLLIAALMTTLRSEIKVKGKSSQGKILERIEDEHGSIKGLSKSRTEKVLASANSLYKSLIDNEMK